MKAFQKMVSLELDDEDKLDALMPIPMEERPEFPYGLRISLTHTEMEKLNLDPDEAEVGGIVHGHFMARVTCVNISEDCCRIELQIEDLEIESEDEENEEEEKGRKY
jgi:hypothetical protein